MPSVRCDGIANGLRSSEAVASFRDLHGRNHFIRVERDFLSESASGEFLLPIGVVHVDAKSHAVLVELPHEAETGANRIWVKPEQLDESVEALT